MTLAIRAEGLVKHYGETKALDGVDLEVPEGKVVGVLGPNGAGKTTAVRVLATLLRHRHRDTLRLGGHDVVKDPALHRFAANVARGAARAETGPERGEEDLRAFRLGIGQVRSSSKWTNRRRDSTRTPATRCGRWCASSSPTARRSCSPRSTWRRPTSSRTRSPCSTTARSWPKGRPDELKRRVGRADVAGPADVIARPRRRGADPRRPQRGPAEPGRRHGVAHRARRGTRCCCPLWSGSWTRPGSSRTSWRCGCRGSTRCSLRSPARHRGSLV